MRQVGVLFFVFFGLLNAGFSHADEALAKRKDVLIFVNKMVVQHHFDRRQLLAIMKEARFQPQIIESMDKPYEKKTWDVYKALFLTTERVKKGIEFWQMNQQALLRAEKEYGVSIPIIVAIIGVETMYGKNQGNYRVLDALTTLAFNYPKRSDFFTKELGEYLLLCKEQGVPANQYMGSYAGAMGKPQFMPSSYRFYAVDFTGDGKRDLMNDDRDVIGSVANYFHKHGYKMNDDIAQPVAMVGSKYKSLATNSRTADYAFNELIRSGVRPVLSIIHPPLKAGIIELTTQKGQEYWMAYPNFYVITRYNTSPQYALVVYLLSQQLSSQWAAVHPHNAHPYG